MSLRESFQNLLKPREVKEVERATLREAAFKQEQVATVDYLEGRMSLDEYQQLLQTTFPLTKLDLRKLASELEGHR